MKMNVIILDMGFVCVATHEFGHALGIKHSDTADAVMYEDFICCGKADVDLYDDDIKAIQVGYMKKIPVAKRKEHE